MSSRFAAALLAGAAFAAAGSAAQAAEFATVRSGNTLVSFDTAAPTTSLRSVTITGLGAGQTLVGMDSRPVTSRVLYGLSNTGQLYAINPTSGAASLVTSSSVIAPVLSGTAFGVDFNPTVDRIRVVSNTGQNLRLNPNDGSLSATDTSLAYAVGDVNFGTTPAVSAAAYTNSFAGATTTTLYVIDPVNGVLAIQNPPNAGVLNTVGSLGVTGNGSSGFDIAPTAGGTAYAIITNAGTGASNLYTVNLTTGAATLVGQLSGATTYNGLALAPTPFATLAGTSAQRSVGRALDNFSLAPTAGVLTLFIALDSDPSATAAGLGQLTPQSYVNLTELGRAAADGQTRSISNHLADARSAAAAGEVASGVFVDASLARADFAAGIDRTRTKADVNGFTVGADTVWGDAILGGSISYADTRAGLDTQLGRAKGESWTGGVYGSWNLGGGYVELQGSASKGDLDLTRYVNIGALSNLHNAEADTRVLAASGKVGVNYMISGFGFEPYVSLDYVESTVRGFAEDGGPSALSVRNWGQTSLRSKLGFRVSGAFEGGGAIIKPELRAAYVYEHKDDPTVIDARLYQTGTNVFRTVAAPLDVRDTAEVGVGVAVIGSRAGSFRIDYDGRVGGDREEHTASMTVNFPF